MKKYAVELRQKYVLQNAICDRCKKECTNTYTDVLLKFSFSDNPKLLETICYACYEKYFKEKLIEKGRENVQ